MKTAFVLVLAAVPSLWSQPIREFLLDQRQVVDLPVSREITCITFPAPIGAVAGAEMLIDSAKGPVELADSVKVRFHVTHAPHSNFVLVQSVQPGAVGRLTILFENAAYILNLRSVESDSLASAIFQRPETPVAIKVEAPPPAVSFNPRIGLSLLDRARAYPVLAQALPKAVEGVTSRVQNRTVSLPDLHITIEEVCRFPREDALVFLLRLRNTSSAVVEVAPSTFAVRIGEERFEQSISNGPRVLQPGEEAEAEFAIVGAPDGTRNDLSADNAFTILVSTSRRSPLVTDEPGIPTDS